MSRILSLDHVIKSLRYCAMLCVEGQDDIAPDINLPDVIARQRGWNPLAPKEKMTVHFGGKEYVIHRLK